MVDTPHVHDGGSARADEFGKTSHGRGPHGRIVMRSFKRKDSQLEPVQKLKIVRESSEKSLTKMEVCLDKAGNRRHVGYVHHFTIKLPCGSYFSFGHHPFNDRIVNYDPTLIHNSSISIHSHNGPDFYKGSHER